MSYLILQTRPRRLRMKVKEYGKIVRITRKMILADDVDYHIGVFFRRLKESRIAGENALEAIEATRELQCPTQSK